MSWLCRALGQGPAAWGGAISQGPRQGWGYHQRGLLPAHVTGQYFPEAAAQAAGV